MGCGKFKIFLVRWDWVIKKEFKTFSVANLWITLNSIKYGKIQSELCNINQIHLTIKYRSLRAASF